MDRHVRIAATLCLASLAWVRVAHAQRPVFRLGVGGGEATDLRGVRSGAVSLWPSVTLFPSSRSVFSLSGHASRYGDGVWAAGGGATLEVRAPIGSGPFGFLLDAGGNATHGSWNATYLQADAFPALEARRGPMSIYAGIKGAAAQVRTRAATPLPGPFPGPAGNVTERHQDAGFAFGAALRLRSFGPGEQLRLRYREERMSPLGVRVIDRSGGADLLLGRLVLVASIGVRDAPDESRTYGGGRMVLTVARGVAVFGALESYPSSRLTGTAAGRSASVGLSLSTGGIRSAGAMPRPSGIPAPRPGLTRVAFRAPSAKSVEVAGDWNRRQPVPLQRAGNGVWYVDLRIEPGEYRYAFRVDGKTWAVPDGVAAVDDGFGGRSAWLTVKATRPDATRPVND